MTTALGAPARITFRDWSWRYAGREAWAVDGLDLTVEAGERVALVGASGSGKSTVLRAVAGVLADEPDHTDDTAAAVRGEVLVDGTDPRAVRGRVGLVMQDPEAHTVMSRIGDDVAFGCENTGVPRAEIWERVRSALDVVGLDLPLDRSTAQLSGGQRQRLALAGVLAMRPGALVLDEPCANLDPDGVVQVHDAVRALLDTTGSTLLVVEHRIGTWLDLVDRLVVLEPGGGVVASGAPDVVLAEHGAALAAAGVWVPGATPARGSARAGVGGAGVGVARAGVGVARAGVGVARAGVGVARAGETHGSERARTRAFRPFAGDAVSEPGAGVAGGGVARAGETHGSERGGTRVFCPFAGDARAAGQHAPAPARPAPGTVLLRARGLATERGKRQPVGRGIDLDVVAGRVLAVTGPNGVGKSTLGLTLAGLLRPASDSAASDSAASDSAASDSAASDTAASDTAARTPTGACTAPARTAPALIATPELAAGAGSAPHTWTSRRLAARIGTVFQDPEHQFLARTVREELEAGPRALGLDGVTARADELLETFGLAHLADANPFTLSGGEQRRLAIGAVVASRPPVVVLDEPTSGQDRSTWEAVVRLLGALADDGTAIVAITHDRDLVTALDADEAVLTPSGLHTTVREDAS